MKAVAFDLGDTLIEYEGVPLNWEAHYPEALTSLAAFLRIPPETDHIASACTVLRRYNTRFHPRENEVAFSTILAEILQCFHWDTEVEEMTCATAFFRVFRQRLRCFPDAIPALDALRKKKVKVGVFTDVPYGMPRELVLEDVSNTSLTQSLDVLLTSRDTGFRKPAAMALRLLAQELSCEPNEMIHIGNERKDVEVAHAIGCYSILIDRARHSHDWGQDRTIHSLSEL
jgi:putative hydrolase of the HAD superfamily